MKRQIFEDRTINDNVQNLTTIITNTIKQDLIGKSFYYENRNINRQIVTIPYKIEDTGITLPLSNFFGGQTQVIIKYKIYFLFSNDTALKSKEGYLRNETNCECNFEENTIRMEGYAVDGKLSRSFTSEIQHEVNHYFQNANGQVKDEDLYGLSQQLIRYGQDWSDKVVGKVLYYSFPTEQDAFASQFYRYLHDNCEDKLLTFDEAQQYGEISEYNNTLQLLNRIPREDLIDILQSIGMTENQFLKRKDKTTKRMYHKFQSAYRKYASEMQQGNISEQVFTIQELLKESTLKKLLTNKHLDFSYT